MNAMYVIAGPTTIGNVFGFFGPHVPDGKFAVVIDGEYTNGGHGPSAEREPCLFASREAAEAAIAVREAEATS